MATIREVAERAGVSTATVSRIINGDIQYKVLDKTKERVWQAIRELDYTPRRGSARRFPKSHPAAERAKIGCVLSVSEGKYNDPYFMSILSGAEQLLMKKGYSLPVVRTYKELENRVVLFNMLNESLSGLILMENLPDETYRTIRRRIPHIVAIDTWYPEIDQICYDGFQVGRQVAEYLLSEDYRRIAFIGGPDYSGDLRHEPRFQGFQYTLFQAGKPLPDPMIRDSRWDRDTCYRCALELVERDTLPEAIFAASDLMALITIKALAEKGLKVPEDIAVVGMSDIEMASYSNPPLTTVHVPTVEMGKTAARALIARIEGLDGPPLKIILPTRLVERGSA